MRMKMSLKVSTTANTPRLVFYYGAHKAIGSRFMR